MDIYIAVLVSSFNCPLLETMILKSKEQEDFIGETAYKFCLNWLLDCSYKLKQLHLDIEDIDSKSMSAKPYEPKQLT